MEYTHEQIRELLKKITPGEWVVGKDDPTKSNEVAYVRGLQIWGKHAAIACKDDAAFIAAAPSIVRQLLEENASLREWIVLADWEPRAL